jgi:hypothetical protein
MSDRPTIDLGDLSPELQKQLAARGIRKPRRHEFSKNDVRTAAIRVLAVVADLTPAQRARVLVHASKLNEV